MPIHKKNSSQNKKNISKNISKDISQQALSTHIIHYSRRQHPESGDVRLPIRTSITYAQPNAQTLINAFQGKQKRFTYARNQSPTVAQLETLVTQMEHGIESVVFSSGMAAIVSPILALLKQDDHIVAGKSIFGNTLSFFRTLSRLGIEVTLVQTSNTSEVKNAIKKNTKLLFLETISNPTTEIPNLDQLQKLLLGSNIITIADNTITTPLLYKPKTHGFTFSHHSLSKYISGHASLLAGSLTDLGNKNWANEENILSTYSKPKSISSGILQIRKKGMRDMGAALSPSNAQEVVQGAETLELRMARHQSNAMAVAKFLESHPKVNTVHYPGLKSHPQHAIAKKHFAGFSGLLSFTLKKGSPVDLLNNFCTIIPATHLGDTRTLALPVAPTIFHELGPQGREKAGIDENLIRLSLGIENENDILRDLDSALQKM